MELSLKELLQITCFLCISTASQAQDQPSGAIVSGDYLFEAFDKTGDYQAAAGFCLARNQWPAEPKTPSLNADLTSILDTDTSHYASYIGLKKSHGGDWFWEKGGSIDDYNNWNYEGSQPGNGECAIILRDVGKWNTVLCDDNIRAFICQSSAPCSTNKNPCLHSGTCTSMNTSPYYTCDCSGTGYYGDTCEVDYCVENSNPCKNGGTCICQTESPHYTCNCANIGYYGDNCERDYCAENMDTCKNGGMCNRQTNFPHYCCNCAITGFYGDTCERDYCAEKLGACKNGGTCNSQTDSPHYSCNCTNTGFYGDNCERDYCVENTGTCKNGGACIRQTDSPHYTCNCPNTGYYGSTCTEKMGKPMIIDISSTECSVEGILNIFWKPSQYSVNVTHRIQALPTTSSAIQKVVYVSPSNDEGLTQSTEYSVLITLCSSQCNPEFSDESNATTGVGLPDEVHDLMVEQTYENTQCKLSWASPLTDSTSTGEKFQIRITETFVYQPPTIEVQLLISQIELSAPITEYSLTPEPNRIYTFVVAAESCAGLGPDSSPTEECIGLSSSPDKVQSPTVVDEGASTMRKVEILFPEEINGPISCFFIIVKPGSIEESHVQSFDITDLRAASTIAFNDQIYMENEYLALAISRNNVSGRTLVATLGDGSTSGCDVSDTPQKMRNSNNYYEAQNRPLIVGDSYSLYSVSSTPVNEAQTKFRASAVETFQNGTVDGMLWIIGLVVGILAAIGAIATGIYVFRKRQHKNQSDSKNGTASPYQEYEFRDPSKGYDNVIVSDGKDANGDEHQYMTIASRGYENVEVQAEENADS